MTLLQLQQPRRLRRLTAVVDSAPTTARPVVLWVGVPQGEIEAIRDVLPARIQRMLDCADAGIPHIIGQIDRRPVTLRRVRYDSRVIGYGIIVSTGQTFEPRAIIPESFSPKVAEARRILQSIHFPASTHLTDRPL